VDASGVPKGVYPLLREDYDMAHAMINQGWDVNKKLRNNRTAIDIVIERTDRNEARAERIINFLMEHGADPAVGRTLASAIESHLSDALVMRLVEKVLTSHHNESIMEEALLAAVVHRHTLIAACSGPWVRSVLWKAFNGVIAVDGTALTILAKEFAAKCSADQWQVDWLFKTSINDVELWRTALPFTNYSIGSATSLTFWGNGMLSILQPGASLLEWHISKRNTEAVECILTTADRNGRYHPCDLYTMFKAYSYTIRTLIAKRILEPVLPQVNRDICHELINYVANIGL
jgi:hypothetical protein